MKHHIIYKYELEPDRIQDVLMPRKAVMLRVGEQRGTLYLWAMHDVAETHKVARRIAVVGTGYSVPQTAVCNYIGTVDVPVSQTERDSGTFVWHVFDNGEVR